MEKEYYVAANGLEYFTREDADTYGGGAQFIRRVQKEVVIPLEPLSEAEKAATPVVTQDESLLREIGKSRGIRGWAIMPLAKLQEKINALPEENSTK